MFKFDPLLAAELREASVTLGIAGLQDVCDKGEGERLMCDRGIVVCYTEERRRW